MNPVKSLSPHICKVDFDKILPSVLFSSKYPLSSAWEKDPVALYKKMSGFGGRSVKGTESLT
jgi:hypothetical protein